MTVLCRLEEIPDGTARGFAHEGRELIVFRRGARVFGHVNSCPHIGTPLEMFPDRFMTADGQHLLCTTHGAMFEPETGLCVRGPCKGKALTRVPVRVESGALECPAVVLDQETPQA